MSDDSSSTDFAIFSQYVNRVVHRVAKNRIILQIYCHRFLQFYTAYGQLSRLSYISALYFHNIVQISAYYCDTAFFIILSTVWLTECDKNCEVWRCCSYLWGLNFMLDEFRKWMRGDLFDGNLRWKLMWIQMYKRNVSMMP